jgi:copper chaperone CopZ
VRTIGLRVGGRRCRHCVRDVNARLRHVPGIDTVTADADRSIEDGGWGPKSSPAWSTSFVSSTDRSTPACWCLAAPDRPTGPGSSSGVGPFRAGVKIATLDPFHGDKDALDDQLEDAVAVPDAFHVVKLATTVVDEVCRRVQQETTGHRGRRDDPLCRVRSTLRAGQEQ